MRFAVLFAVLLAATGCLDKSTGTGASAVSATKKTYSRDEFKALVMGKTEAEVIAAVGRPDSTSESNLKIWYYNSITRDPVTGKVDVNAQVVFSGDRVGQVNY